MQLRTRLSLGSLFAASAVLSTILAWHAQRQPAPQIVVAPMPIVQAAPVAAPAEAASTDEPTDTGDSEGEAPGPDAPSATIAKLDLAWMPNGYVRDVGDDKTTALAQLVEGWAASDSEEPRILYRKGVVFARSEEDLGGDGPYPRSVHVQDQRVCGEASVWLRAALQRRLANDSVTCDRNVCSYSGGEYAPDGFLVFHEIDLDGEKQWTLDAWIEVYRADLSSETIAQNQADVVRALRHEADTSCAGEPAGAY
jgi:hypothetical protein